MVIYAMILFLSAVLFAGIALAVYRGNTNLIHDYHRKKVSDKAAYGRDFGKALFILSGTFVLSGIISLLGETDGIAIAAVAILVAGLAVGILVIVRVQKKHNQGVF